MDENYPHTPARLFYSYSHIDETYRAEMEKSLSILRQEGLLYEWFDGKILPGENLSPIIIEEMKQANIFAFLISPDFIASPACKKEWEYARELCTTGTPGFRIPIILRACPWLDMLKGDDVKALPVDGKPVASYEDQDKAWLEVYQGIKKVVNEIGNCFTPREEFIDNLESTEFISQQYIKLHELFVFPRLTKDVEWDIDQPPYHNATVKGEDILRVPYTLIHGADKSGKTALARHLYLTLVEEHKAVLLVDLKERRDGLNDNFLRQTYQTQFHGEFSLWNQQSDKTLIIENMTESLRAMEFIEQAQERFEKIIVTTSSDTFYSYFKKEIRLSNFEVLRIGTLTREQQEQLIRKRLELLEGQPPITDGRVDQEEDAVNSVIISNKLIPRYPFYVLSILQTREGFMPTNMAITSYGHCYHALIVASLIRAGISKADEEVGACFNLGEELAYRTYLHRSRKKGGSFDFVRFIEEYNERFLIRPPTVNRLKHPVYGIIDEAGDFRTEYMYYFFLGRFLASNKEKGTAIISKMCEDSHVEVNYLTLLFTIHHARDNEIIDNILLRTMCTLDAIAPAKLDQEETKRFANVVLQLPKDVLSTRSVQDERRSIRATLPDEESPVVDAQTPEAEVTSIANEVYRILKNNRIMGQILKNHYGAIERAKVEEIISVITSSGLRLVNLTMQEEEDLGQLVIYIQDKHPTWSVTKIQKMVESLSFIWTVGNIEMIVSAINTPEIREAVETVVQQESTPAYDLVGYFSQLDSAEELRERDLRILKSLWDKHEDPFIQRLLSLRTQIYMNTHKSHWKTEKQICSAIGIKRVRRLAGGED